MAAAKGETATLLMNYIKIFINQFKNKILIRQDEGINAFKKVVKMITISDFEDFIKENNYSDMVRVNRDKLIKKPLQLWFWISLKQIGEAEREADRYWLDFMYEKEKI